MARIPYPESGNGADHPMNLVRMLAHSEPVMEGFGKLGLALLFEAALAPRLREIAILRIGLTAHAEYEVSKHLTIGRGVGLTEAELDALHPGADPRALGAVELAVLRITDELILGTKASDAALAAVREHLGDREVVELVVTCGYYGLVCRVLETLGVDREEP